MMNKRNGLLALAALVIVLPMTGWGQEKDDLRALMQRKLQSAQKVLEGIALDDPNKVSKGGEDLLLISKEAEWKVLKTPQYEMFSNDFRRAVSTLIEKSKDRNIDGAALAYVDMTLSCVKCHRYVREVRQSRLDDR